MKKILSAILSMGLIAAFAVCSFAGEWKQEADGRWWYQNDDGSYTTNNWQQIDGKYYYFDAQGWMLSNTTTPDGYQVGADGAWIQGGTETSAENANTAAATGNGASGLSSASSSQYASLAAADFRSIKNKYSSAEPLGAYIKSFRMDGDNCVMVYLQYKIVSTYSETFMHNLSTDNRITEPESYYKSQKSRAYGANKIRAIDRESTVLRAIADAIQNGEYIDGSQIAAQ